MRDHTKYIFQGQRLGKAPLVRALVNQYVRDNPSMRFDQLRAPSPITCRATTLGLSSTGCDAS